MTLKILYLSRAARVPEALERFLEGEPGNEATRFDSPADVEQALDRGIVELLVLDADQDFDGAAGLCARLKGDPFNSVVPIVFYSREHRVEEIARAFESGADEFLSGTHSGREQLLRLRMVLKRAERDVSVHPSTMLPGTKIIQHDIQQRIASGERFAVCYADIDSFKEFNDKYSYPRGDRVIRILSLILRDTVRRLSRRGFVGHIGGDDFIYTLPFEDLDRVSEAIIETFDTLLPLQYSAEDQARGSYLAEDRQGNLREIPLMTLSIGCVTNVRRRFTHPAKVSELASEMKAYAKSFKGSLYVVDRRRDHVRSRVAARPEDSPSGEPDTP
ncbi:MAG TPA: diguanylate cyclase [Gemmatimonadota bacterium]|nr:diguanylate cyclase [Gemmatimonadota bacterium]